MRNGPKPPLPPVLHQRQKPLSRSHRSLCAPFLPPFRPNQMRNPACPKKREGRERKKSPQVSWQSHSTGMGFKLSSGLRDSLKWLIHLSDQPCAPTCPTLSPLSLHHQKRGFAAAQWTNSMAAGVGPLPSDDGDKLDWTLVALSVLKVTEFST